jgi:hypothetical protein
MRRLVAHAARSALVPFLLLAACDAGPSTPEPATTPAPARAASPETTVAKPAGAPLGIGEPRKPQPFTLAQRLLDAVQRDDRGTIERALELGAPLDAKDDLGRSVVLLATSDAGDAALVEWLHEKGAALDEPDVSARAALSFAADAGRLDMVRYLVERGAVVDRPDVQGRTPLFHAALADHPDVAAFLLDRGAAVNPRDSYGDTPLIVACAKGFAATAALLLERGADPSLRDQEGRTAAERSAPGVEPCRRPGRS